MYEIYRTIGVKGQLVLPKDIRKMFNLRQGSEVKFRVEDNKVILEPTDADKFVDEFCSVKLKKRPIEEIKRMIKDEVHR